MGTRKELGTNWIGQELDELVLGKKYNVRHESQSNPRRSAPPTQSVLSVLSDPIQNVHMQTTLSKLVESVTSTTTRDHLAGGISHQAVEPVSSINTSPFSDLWCLRRRPATDCSQCCHGGTNLSKSRSPDDHLASNNSATESACTPTSGRQGQID